MHANAALSLTQNRQSPAEETSHLIRLPRHAQALTNDLITAARASPSKAHQCEAMIVRSRPAARRPWRPADLDRHLSQSRPARFASAGIGQTHSPYWISNTRQFHWTPIH